METVNKNNLPQAIKDIPADEFQPLNTSTLKERAYCHTVFKFLTRLMASFEKE